MLFHGWTDLIRVIVVCALAYGALILILRVAGKRSLSKLNAFDLVVTVALGSTLATVLLNRQVSLAEGVMALGMLTLLQWLVSRGSVASASIARAVRSDPRLLFEDGQYRDGAMVEERVTRSEIDAAIRQAGIGDLGRVAAVVLESDGSMSVLGDAQCSDRSALGSVRR